MKELLFVCFWPVAAVVIDDGHNDCEPELQEHESLVCFVVRVLVAVALLPVWFAIALAVSACRRLGKVL